MKNSMESRMQELADKWLKNEITEEEKAEFLNWYNSADDGNPIAIPEQFSENEVTHGLLMFKNINEQASINTLAKYPIPLYKRPWLRYAAAILIVLGIASYFFSRQPDSKQLIVHIDPTPAKKDVHPPASANAIVTLEDGRSIVLDSANNGLLATQGNVQLKKMENGEIVYEGVSDKISYNTLNNPRGSRVIQVTLADGTKVWLNSESSLRYPTGFTGAERIVEVTGETYFEVAENRAQPFKVRKNDMEITVTGTHFNVKAYDDEEKLNVTLLQGAVTVSSDTKNTVQLKPGEQSQLTRHGKLSVVNDVNLEDVLAWKNGKFVFDGRTDIGTIMRELSRWYNLDVNYRGTVRQHFGGSISRFVNLSQVLKILETTGSVKFEVEGNKVTVMP